MPDGSSSAAPVTSPGPSSRSTMRLALSRPLGLVWCIKGCGCLRRRWLEAPSRGRDDVAQCGGGVESSPKLVPRRLVQLHWYDLGGELDLITEVIGVVSRAGDQPEEEEKAEA